MQTTNYDKVGVWTYNLGATETFVRYSDMERLAGHYQDVFMALATGVDPVCDGEIEAHVEWMMHASRHEIAKLAMSCCGNNDEMLADSILANTILEWIVSAKSQRNGRR